MKNKKINLLTIEWVNKEDLDPLRKISEKSRIRFVNFDDVFKIEYDLKTRILRYWMHLKRFRVKDIGHYLRFIKEYFFTKKYSYHFDNVRKLNVMSLKPEDFKKLMDDNKIDGIVLHRADPWLHNIIIYANKLGIKVIVLNHEHLYTRNRYAKMLIKSHHFRPDLMLVGGECGRRYWSQSKGADEKKIRIVGVTRFDEYFSKNLMKRDEFCSRLGLDPEKKIVFFPSHVNYFTFFRYNITDDILKKIFEPENLDFCWNKTVTYRMDTRDFKKDVLSVMYKAAKENPDIQFITKLHPDQQLIEEQSIELEMIAAERRLPNFVGIMGRPKDIASRDIIANSDLIIGNNSTMLLEAVMMDKSVLVPDFRLTKELKGLPLYEWGCCEKADDKDELMKKMLSILKNGEDMKRYLAGRKKILEYYFYKQDGKASKRALMAIEELFR